MEEAGAPLKNMNLSSSFFCILFIVLTRFFLSVSMEYIIKDVSLDAFLSSKRVPQLFP